MLSADGKIVEVKKVKINWSMALGLGPDPRKAGKVARKQLEAAHKERCEKDSE